MRTMPSSYWQTPTRSSPPIAGGQTGTCRSSAASCAGHTCGGTSRRTPKGSPPRREFGEHGLALCERVFWGWEVFVHTGDRRELKRTVRALRRQYKPIIRSYAAKRARNKRCRGMAHNLLKVWPALWTFAGHDKVEPTNNHAERGLRSAVIYRKLSLASQSEQGELRTSRLLSAHTTCRLQHRSLFAYLTNAITTHARGDPAPLLT